MFTKTLSLHIGIAIGAAAVIYARPRIPAILWWLFSRGDT